MTAPTSVVVRGKPSYADKSQAGTPAVPEYDVDHPKRFRQLQDELLAEPRFRGVPVRLVQKVVLRDGRVVNVREIDLNRKEIRGIVETFTLPYVVIPFRMVSATICGSPPGGREIKVIKLEG